MRGVDPATVKRYASTVAVIAIEDTLDHWDNLDQYFPDEDLRDAIEAECGAIARRLRSRGAPLPERRDGK